MLTLLTIVKHSLMQFLALFGAFIIGGLLLSFPSRWMNNVFRQFVLPRAGLFLFGAIGIPVHEFSHAFFCKVFFHQIQSIKWFDPKAKSGVHGAVTHDYNPWNPYHRIGHFFIGLGPAIFGPLLLGVLFYWLVPAGHPCFAVSDAVGDIRASSVVTLAHLFKNAIVNKATLASPGFYVFIYFAVAISSQIELSPEDVKQAVTGVVPIVLILLAVNVFAWSIGMNWHAKILPFGTRVFALAVSLFTIAAIASFASLAIVTVTMSFINQITGREGINPFRNA